ncbi:MAG: hypothetical protein ACYTG5_21870 [Planctomycetota bacterium]|jgi:hypothetical protein
MRLLLFSLVMIFGSACSSGPELLVPHFAADDERVSTAGFVRETTRIDREMGETTYTLMIFAVGEQLTLGAMVKGEFEGTAHWQVGERRFSLPFSRGNRGGATVPVESALSTEELSGEHAGFDDFDWVNVDVPLAEWLPEDGTRVSLEFTGLGDFVIRLPETGRSFVSRVEAR